MRDEVEREEEGGVRERRGRDLGLPRDVDAREADAREHADDEQVERARGSAASCDSRAGPRRRASTIPATTATTSDEPSRGRDRGSGRLRRSVAGRRGDRGLELLGREHHASHRGTRSSPTSVSSSGSCSGSGRPPPAARPSPRARPRRPRRSRRTTTVMLSSPPPRFARATSSRAALSRSRRCSSTTSRMASSADHVGQPVGAEQEHVAGPRLDRVRVDVDVGVGAERAGDHGALRVRTRPPRARASRCGSARATSEWSSRELLERRRRGRGRRASRRRGRSRRLPFSTSATVIVVPMPERRCRRAARS